MSPDDPRHGTTAGYHAGCRDKCCRAALARYEKAGRLARLHGGLSVPALGAQRRLQALMRLGWSSTAIARTAGVGDRNHVWRIVSGQKGKPTTWLERHTDAWVRAVYDQLCMTIPTSPYADRTARHAERRGWAPPLAWDNIDDPDEQPHGDVQGDAPDAVVVERILAGDWRLDCTPADKTEVVRRWHETGRSLRSLQQLTTWKPERYFRAAEQLAGEAA